MSTLGGRKFLGLVICVAAVVHLAYSGADSSAFGAVGLMYTAFCGGNAAIEWKHASSTAKSKTTERKA